MADFRLRSEIAEIETIAAGRGINELKRLNRTYGRGHWRKLKGVATIEFENGKIWLAELHWYEAHGIGRRELKSKRRLKLLR